jgi:transcriptional regulator with AAA-type ATPase domain
MPRSFDDDESTRGAKLDEIHRLDLTGAEVAVLSGPDAGATLSLGPAAVVVGTGVGCDLRLTDELVSRQHLELSAEKTGVRALDRESRNGTFYEGARVRDVSLVSDATLRIGDTELTIRVLRERLALGLSQRTRFGDAIARSDGMRYVFSLLEQAARSEVTVLLEGDSGTGKDVLAHAAHQESAHKDGPFVVVDCGAIPEGLLESELFGHERGAFTGAIGTRAGAFEQASGGTLFLDEIGELPLEAQPKLLRALEVRTGRGSSIRNS